MWENIKKNSKIVFFLNDGAEEEERRTDINDILIKINI